MAEQLLFTWADRGLEGRGMWQVVAATERLYTKLPAARRQARDLCTDFVYPSIWQDPATAPVSLGWRDIGGVRYAFRRLYRGTDAFGRPGVFAAHVLVDRPERLPADRLLRAADSPRWWSGEPLAEGDAEWLPPVSLESFSQLDGTSVDNDVTAAVLTAVLAHRGRPVLLAMDAAVAAGALAQAAKLLPGIFDDLSVSTYEPSMTRANYDLAATQSPDDDPRAIAVKTLLDAAAVATHRNIARLVLDSDPRSSAYVHHAWSAALRSRSQVRESFIDICAAYLAVHNSALPSTKDLVPALRHRDTAADLLDHEKVRAAVATSLGSGDASAEAALRAVGAGLEPETWISLGDLTAQAVTESAFVAAIWLFRSMSREGFRSFVDRLVRLAAADHTQVARWPLEVLPDVWTHTTVRTTAPVQNAVVTAGSRSLHWFAAHAGTPPDLWARMLIHAVQTNLTDAEPAARDVCANPAFANEVGMRAQTAVLTALLQALPSRLALTLLSGWSPIPGRAEEWTRLAKKLAGRLDDRDAWQAAAAIAPSLPHPAPDQWSTLRDYTIHRRLAYELSEVGSQSFASKLEGALAHGAADRAWRRYLRLLGDAAVRDWPGFVAELARSVADLPEAEQDLATRFALQDAVARTQDARDVDRVVVALNQRPDVDWRQTAELVLHGGLRATVTRDNLCAGVAALVYVAVWLVESGALPLRKKTRELSSPSAQKKAHVLYGELATRYRGLDKFLHGWTKDRPRAEHWLKSLRG